MAVDLSPIIINGRVWKRRVAWVAQECQHCGTKRRSPKGLDYHERVCYLNSERKCPHCYGTGEVPWEAEGVGGNIPCPTCEKAEERRKERADLEKQMEQLQIRG